MLIFNNLKLTSIGLICGFLSSYFSVYNNQYSSEIIQGDLSDELLFKLFKSSVYCIIFTSLRGSIFTYIQKTMNYNIKYQVYNKLLNQSPLFYETTTISYLNDLINNDTRIVSDIISLYINVITRSLFTIIITLYLLYKIAYYKYILIILFVIPMNLGINHIYDKIYKYKMINYDDINKNFNNFILESISHISLLKSFAVEDKYISKFTNLNNQISNYALIESYLYGFNAFINYNLPVISMIMIIIISKYLNTTSGLLTFIIHYKSLFGTITDLINIKSEISKGLKSYERIIQILKLNDYKEGHFIPNNNDIIPYIKFENICFKYQNSPKLILDNFNLNINANEKLAIIGRSGSGKSTLAKILIGILKINSGVIKINNIDINIYDSKWLKSKIGYVSQETVLFSDTIANNINFGLDNYNETQIKEAAIMANADEFIVKLKDGYNTKFEGTELTSLSGGQKQRIAIARALIKNPKILIFDEATSALDPYCEEIVQSTIKNCVNTKNMTFIIIAHRKSALELANKIYDFDINKYINT